MTYLAPYAEFVKTPDGNVKLVSFRTEGEHAEQERGAGYNPMVKEVFDSIYNKFGNKPFIFKSNDVPTAIRHKMPAGLLPKIMKYLIEVGALEQDEKKEGKYKIVRYLESPVDTELDTEKDIS